MKTIVPTIILALAALATGCASTGALEQRMAQLEQELKAARATPSRPAPGAISPSSAVAMGDMMAASAPAYVVFVDEKPDHCDGALCWEIVNNHRNPVLLTINGQQAAVVGPMGPLLPPGSHGYVRLVNPGRMEITYGLYDSMRLGDNGMEMPLATVLSQCHVAANVGGSNDAYWGGHTTRLSTSFCRG